MEPQIKKKLCIIKDVNEVSNFHRFIVLFVYKFIIFCLLISPLYYELWRQPSHVGDITAQILEDIKTCDKRQIPVSAWMERKYILNGSAYQKSLFELDRQMTDIIYFNFSIFPFFKMFFQVVISIGRNFYFITKNMEKKFGLNRVICYITLKNFVSILFVCSVFCCFHLLTELCENIFRWADSRVHDATPLLDMHKAFLFPHPFTLGHAPPFFLLTYSRYLMEDVVFICEYQTRDPDPIYKSANWRKNGRPLTSNDDRIQINVTVNQVDNLELYNVLSILTIQFLEDQDFGSYTCEYHNPFNSEVQPGPSMTSEFRYKSENDIPIPPPDSECNCKPKTTNPDQCTNQPIIIPVQCFSEFVLNKRNEQVLTKMISPGSMFIEGAFYSTVSESENIGVELSRTESKDPDQNCCSWFVRTYWRFFRKGGFLSENPPFTRTIITENGLSFLRYQCMCKSSYGMSEFRIFRNFINTTSGRGDRAEIVYPVRHKLFPVYTDPWSSNQSDADENIYRDTHSCFESDFSSEECWVHEQLFESNLKRMISYEFGLTFAIMLVPTLIAVLFYYSVMKGCIRPLLTFVLYGDIRGTTFEAVNGKSLTKFRLRRCHKARIAPDVHRQQYDIYLSYDSENEFDSMIAEHIKGILVSLKLTYFDSQMDVQYGHLILTEQEKAIANSLRYVCIVSQSYIEHNSVEFNAIQLAIVGQNSKLKDRLLIVKSEVCDVERLYLIPCISVPEEARARSVLNERTVREFFKWQKSTSVHELAGKSDKLTAIKGILGLKTMIRPLIILMAQMFIIFLDTFTLNS